MRIKIISTTLLALLGASLASNTAYAAPREFKIDDDKKRDFASFNSDAPLELIEGKTSKITGHLTIDDSLNLTKPVAATFEVDLASIDTGIELRNEHMRDNFLQTKQFPTAKFVLESISKAPSKLEAGKKTSFQAQGSFSLHGKTVKKQVPIEVTYFTKCPATESKRTGCDLIQIKATFPVAFKDHDIKRPEIVFQKLADTVIVTVSATAYNQVGATGSKEANPKK